MEGDLTACIGGTPIGWKRNAIWGEKMDNRFPASLV